MHEYLAAFYHLIGTITAPPVNWLTELLMGILPMDIAKTIVVVLLYALSMRLVQLQQNVAQRALMMVLVLCVVTAAVMHSDRHITTASFLFGDYVRLIEKYF